VCVCVIWNYSVFQINAWLKQSKTKNRRPEEEISFETFMAVVFQVEVFRLVTPCNVVVGYQRFRGLCYLHLLDCDAV
jgi:hypothetical protein